MAPGQVALECFREGRQIYAGTVHTEWWEVQMSLDYMDSIDKHLVLVLRVCHRVGEFSSWSSGQKVAANYISSGRDCEQLSPLSHARPTGKFAAF